MNSHFRREIDQFTKFPKWQVIDILNGDIDINGGRSTKGGKYIYILIILSEKTL